MTLLKSSQYYLQTIPNNSNNNNNQKWLIFFGYIVEADCHAPAQADYEACHEADFSWTA